MSINVDYNGVTYVIPEVGDTGWGPDVTQYLNALSTGGITQAGGLYPLLADLDFTSGHSLVAGKMIANVFSAKTDTGSVGAFGVIRLKNSDWISWRNVEDTDDVVLTVGPTNKLLLNGDPIGETIPWGSITGEITDQDDVTWALDTAAVTAVWSAVEGNINLQTDLMALLNAKAPLVAAVPTGGTTGQVLTKVDGSNYNVQWAASSAASVAWGAITGTISSQSDLQTALNLKANLASPTFTGTVSGITKAMVGLGNVDNTADTAKPVSTAQQTALDGKAALAAGNPTGGATGQVLTKNTGTNYDYSWQTPTGGGGGTPDIFSPFLLMGG